MNRKIGVGVLWNLANLFMSRGASVLFTLFLARFLAPEAFGLIAMIAVCFELAGTLAESGLGQALIRSKAVTQADLSTVFFTNLGLSALTYAILFFAAPYVADFYDRAELVPLVRAVGLVVFFNALKVVQIATLRRRMDFKAEMTANTTGVITAGICAVSAAYLGAGVWSLAAQMLITAAVSSGILWTASAWRPSPAFSYDSFRRLFGFGFHLGVEGLLDVLYRNSYVLVIGRFFSAELAGLYFFSRRLNDLVSQQLTRAVQHATFPALATLQDDNAVLRHKYRRIIQLTMFIIAPIMAALAVLADPLLELLFDDKWAGAVPYIQLLSVVGLLYPLHSLNVNILNVKGRSDLVLRIGLAKKAVNMALLIATIPFGVAGIITGQIAGSCLALLPNTYYSAKLIAYPFKDQLLDTCKPVAAAGAAALSAYSAGKLLGGAHVLLELATASGLGLLVYLAVSLALKAEGYVLAQERVLRRRGRLPEQKGKEQQAV